MVQERDPIMTIVLIMCTCGIYALYWLFQTSKELIELKAELPELWFIIIPGLNLYFMYKYLEEWHRIVKYEQDFMMVLLIAFVFSPIVIYWVQIELNKLV
ncbi:MAG: DUF4234 domain-containing protein [Candidatus Heimdallarchaeota archaeon]|nr:DUF4234 domain-containing protein [Candidatus Heimdallarchaeota archaeon]MCK4291092.1 DUF4234 domain-containing protein [Candidatus Heimdallarchaeota archaeon]